MLKTRNILAISGSTRAASSNLSLLMAIQQLAADYFNIQLFTHIAELPHFNPDLDQEPAPAQVKAFRDKIKQADGVLICTPEYAMGVPGTLKNALDWTVSSAEFSKKPTALITASSVGQKGHASLLETLKVIECRISDTTQLLIPFIKTKINAEPRITDLHTLQQVTDLLHAFRLEIDKATKQEQEASMTML